MSVPAPAAAPDNRIDPIVWKISSVVVLGPLMTNLDSTVVNVSLSTLSRELRAPLTEIQWVSGGYLLALALMLPLSGWLVERFGAKRIYIFCFGMFTLASLLCGAAHSAAALIASRVLQGMVGGLMAPMAQMMTARIAGRHIARVMGFIVIPILIGPIFGPVLAGAILQHGSWRWIFWINLPIGLLAMLLAIRILPQDVSEGQTRPFDLVGFLLLPPGLVLLLHSLERLSMSASESSMGELLLAIVLLSGFARHARRLGPAALVDLGLFRRRTFSAAASVQFLSNAVSFGGQMLLPLYLLEVLHKSPGSTGLLLVPAGLGALCSYPLMGTLTERFGLRAVSFSGAALAFLGTLPFALGGKADMPVPLLCAALFVRGAGLGAINIPSVTAAYAAIPKPLIPAATTALNIAQRLGGPAATLLLAVTLHWSQQTYVSELPKAFALTFGLLCALHLAGTAATLRLPIRKEQAAF